MSIQKIPKEDVFKVIEKLGPCQPIDIRKDMKLGDSFLIGALLSELVAEGKLLISHTRRGGSPFYYDPTRQETLEKISQYLNEKDRRTCAMLKEQKVMREDAQDPLVRVGLQHIEDFSKKIEVDGVVYWRYFLVAENDAIKIVKGVKEEKKEEKEEVKEEQKPKQADSVQKIEVIPETQEKPKKKRAPRKTTQTTLGQPQDLLSHDTLYEKVQKFATEQKTTLTNPQILKMQSEFTCNMIFDGVFGKVTYFVLALNKKKITEKDIAKAILAARGMPLLVLSVEDIPVKLAKGFEGMQNVYLKKL